MTDDANLHSIMVLDIERFTERVNPLKGAVREALHDLVRAAVSESELPWDADAVNDTGDGMLIVFPSGTPPARIAGPMVAALAALLARSTDRADAADESDLDGSFRLRISLHHGLVHRDERGWYGEAVDFAFRLVEADALRGVLEAAARSHIALIVSDDVYRTVIRHRYLSIDPAKFASVRFDAKRMVGIEAWIHVPGRPHPPGLPACDAESVSPGSSRPNVVHPDLPQPVVHNRNHAEVVKGDQVAVKNVYLDPNRARP